MGSATAVLRFIGRTCSKTGSLCVWRVLLTARTSNQFTGHTYNSIGTLAIMIRNDSGRPRRG